MLNPTTVPLVGVAAPAAALPSRVKALNVHRGAKIEEMVQPSTPGVGSSMEKGATWTEERTVPGRVRAEGMEQSVLVLLASRGLVVQARARGAVPEAVMARL